MPVADPVNELSRARARLGWPDVDLDQLELDEL
jgi:hypothetical protein